LLFLYKYYVCCQANSVRYLRLQGAKIGENCDLLCGLNGFSSSEPYLIELGNNVTLTQNVILVTHDGGSRVFRHKHPNWHPGTGKYGKIIIGDDVFIGVRTIILPDVKIGSNVVVGAGSVVTRDLPDNVVAVGVPAKVHCTLDDYIQRLVTTSITIPESEMTKKRSYLSKYYWGSER